MAVPDTTTQEPVANGADATQESKVLETPSAETPEVKASSVDPDSMMDQIEALMNPDASANLEEDAKAAVERQAAAETRQANELVSPVTQPATPASQVTAPTTQLQPTPPPVDAQVATLTATVQALQQQLAAMQTQAVVQNPATTSTARPPLGEPPAGMYNVQIPPEVQQMISSEDPQVAGAGMSRLVGMVGDYVHRNVMKTVVDEFGPQMRQEIQGTIQSQHNQQSQREAVFNDFYTNNPDLNRPELYPLVTNTATQVASQIGASSWTPQLRDAVAQQVRTVLRSAAGVVSPQPAAGAQAAIVVPQAPGGVPPAQFRQTTRPGVSEDDANLADIRNTLGFQ